MLWEADMAAEIKVRRANKILRIDESNKKTYLDLGYDVIDAKGNVIEHNKKNVTMAEYEKLVAENKALKAELEKLKSRKGKAE